MPPLTVPFNSAWNPLHGPIPVMMLGHTYDVGRLADDRVEVLAVRVSADRVSEMITHPDLLVWRVSPPPSTERYGLSVWGSRAALLAERAVGEILAGEDAMITLDLAVACLKVEAGELPADELADTDWPDGELGGVIAGDRVPRAQVDVDSWLRDEVLAGENADPESRYILRVHPDVRNALADAAVERLGQPGDHPPRYGHADLTVDTAIDPGGWALNAQEGSLSNHGRLRPGPWPMFAPHPHLYHDLAAAAVYAPWLLGVDLPPHPGRTP